MTFHCGYYERARYLLDLITQAHIFDYNQSQMFPPEKEKKPINNFHRELSVDEYAPKPEYDRKCLLDKLALNQQCLVFDSLKLELQTL